MGDYLDNEDSQSSIQDITYFKHLQESTNYSEKGSPHLQNLIRIWEIKQQTRVSCLREELDLLSRNNGDVKTESKILEDESTIEYWKERALQLENLVEDGLQREQGMMDKLEESMESLERGYSPVELSRFLKRGNIFLEMILENAPVVMGHQDKELRYRFIYNHFPSLKEEDIIGKTETEVFSGGGVKESQDFKKEVMQRGLPAKREITYETGLFGSKTFLLYVEPVFSKDGETFGVNYVGMDITDQVIKREKIAKLQEEAAVQKEQEAEAGLKETTQVADEAKQNLTTISPEIITSLAGVVSMAKMLATSKLNEEQRQKVDEMISSGDLLLRILNEHTGSKVGNL
ncbi:hypothetical protein ACHQM5_030244 [Ranunculus cassubicifolius]